MMVPNVMLITAVERTSKYYKKHSLRHSPGPINGETSIAATMLLAEIAIKFLC